VNSEKAFAVLQIFLIGRTVITIFSCLYSNISENADTVCQVQVCEARTCDLGFEVMTVTNALSTADNDTCCPKTVCVLLTALQSTALPLTLRPPTSQPMTTWPLIGVPPVAQPMTARPPCPPLVEPACGKHQVSRLVTGSSAAQHLCPRLVCGKTFISPSWYLSFYSRYVCYTQPLPADLQCAVYTVWIFLKLIYCKLNMHCYKD
jgi:hypothetical protein